MKDLFLEALQNRFSCKSFSNQQINPEDFEAILEAGRITPSSFGLEPTRVLVIENQELRQAMQTYCWNQKQIVEADKLVVLTSKIMDLDSQSNYATNMFKRRTGEDKEALINYKDIRYKNFLQENSYTDSQSIFNWTSRQAYLVASSMINCASLLKIDSCAIEGFEKKPLEKLLGLDPFVDQISLIIAFGYHKNKPSKKAPRIAKEDFAKYIY